MSEDTKPRSRVLTREEQAAIMALPEREFSFGGVRKRGLYDETNHKFYFLKDDGSLEGKVAEVTFKDRTEDTIPEERESEAKRTQKIITLGDVLRKAAGASDEEIRGNQRRKSVSTQQEDKTPASVDASASPSDDRKRHGKSKLVFGLSIVIVLIFLLIFILPGSVRNSLRSLSVQSNSYSGTTIPVTPQSLENETDGICIIQVTCNLLPGTRLNADQLTPLRISQDSYDTFCSYRDSLYLWSAVEDLFATSNYATRFIPKGQFLGYDDVSAVSPIMPNPWILENSGHQYVTIPISDSIAGDDRLTFGSLCDAEIIVSSVSDTRSQEEDLYIDNMRRITVSENKDKYLISGVVICDILDSEQNSLYEDYRKLAEIPSGLQLSYLRNSFRAEPEMNSMLTPKYVLVRLTSDQAKALGDVTSSNAAVTMSLSGTCETGTDQKHHIAFSILDLRKKFVLAHEEIQKEGGENDYRG